MQETVFTPATTRSGAHMVHVALRAGPAPLGASDIVHVVFDPHRAAVTPSPEWNRLGRRIASMISTFIGRALNAAHVRAPRRA